MTEFTPVLSLSGELLIGLSAAAAFVLFGRVIGVSGIVARTSDFDFGEGSWRPFFLLGLILTPLILSLVAPSPHGFEPMGLIPMLVGGFWLDMDHASVLAAPAVTGFAEFQDYLNVRSLPLAPL